jgi:hypothetical protein
MTLVICALSALIIFYLYVWDVKSTDDRDLRLTLYRKCDARFVISCFRVFKMHPFLDKSSNSAMSAIY